MKKSLVLLGAIFVSALTASDYHYGKYVYFNPSLTADSAPHSYYTRDKIKRTRPKKRVRRRRVVPVMKKRVVYQPVEYVYYEPQAYREPKVCTTKNNIVKEINRGAPRRVINGTYKVCDEAVGSRYKSENFHWRWSHSNPGYSKTPIYVENQPQVSRFGRRHTDYRTVRYNDARDYYYR
ncbi:MAG: hypothetical protein COB02_13615 [Candidatus Cloacimonadota bacterium]|nr:MAG: hypothetical protein COB02_13615 [Candidatus Cloacimonadota bacterium]